MIPGQIPVMAAKYKNTAGTYSSQCASENPVNQMPAQITEPVTSRKNRMDLPIM